MFGPAYLNSSKARLKLLSHKSSNWEMMLQLTAERKRKQVEINLGVSVREYVNFPVLTNQYMTDILMNSQIFVSNNICTVYVSFRLKLQNIVS